MTSAIEILGIEHLLAVDEISLAWRRLLCEMASQLAHATLVGNPAPFVERVSKRLRDPQVGDYVYERSTFHRHRFEDGTPIQAEGSGFLRKVADEYAWTDDVWADELTAWLADDSHDPALALTRPTERVYYVQYGPKPEDECRWHNCEFQVVPLDPSIFERKEAFVLNPDGSRTATRDSLFDSLAEMGFHLKPRTTDDTSG